MARYGARKKFVIQGMDSHLCNQRCDFCYLTIEEDQLELGPQKSYLSKSAYRAIADKTIAYLEHEKSFQDLVVTGGETLVSPEIFRIYEAVGKANPDIRFHIVTNGLVFPKRWQELLYARGNKASFSISLNASCQEVYQRHHRRGSFAQIDANIRKLVKDKRDGLHSMDLAATSVVTSQTVDDIFRFYAYCDEVGLDYCAHRFNTDSYTDSSLVHHLTAEGLSVAQREIERIKAYQKAGTRRCILTGLEDLEAFFEFIARQFEEGKGNPGNRESVRDQARDRRKGMMTYFPITQLSSFEVSEACPSTEDIFISTNGSVGVCCWSEKFFGNLIEGQSLEELANSADRKNFIKEAHCGKMVGCKEACGTLQSIRAPKARAVEASAGCPAAVN